ncbi:hypothetical protein K8R03_03130 [Candidatus Kaiserbacteria bacterium]|nr:hypothetical protein [Candidatus Kaiserbacteria bacterium]
MSHNPIPVTLAVGLRNTQVAQELRSQLSSYRMDNNLENPIHVLEGVSAGNPAGFTSIRHMMHKTLQHAAIVRRKAQAFLAVGVAHGPLYIPAMEISGGPYLFDTLFLGVADVYGPIAWCWPAAACPGGLELTLRAECLRQFTVRKSLRRVTATQKQQDLAGMLLDSLVENIRPLPKDMGITRCYS